MSYLISFCFYIYICCRLAALLKTKSKNIQLLYQLMNCIWLLSYDRKVAEQMGDTKVIAYLIEILRTIPKEKVIRMGLATLRVHNHFLRVLILMHKNILESFGYCQQQ